MTISFPATEATSPCGLCGSTSAFLVSRYCRYGESLHTVACARCGLGRRDPMPSEDELDAYYHQGYRIELGKGRRPAKGRLWRIANSAVERALDLLPRLPKNPVTLDIGCGAGELVYMLAAAGSDSSGFDPDSSYIDWAQTVVGPMVTRKNIQDAGIAPSSLDLVTLYHVLEHLRDPQAALARCFEWLKDDGLLVIEVPNFESTVQGPGHIYQKGHLYYYSLDTLRAVAAAVGFRFEDGGTFYAGENLRCYFRKSRQRAPFETAMPGNVKHILATLQAHTRWSHYLSGSPYQRTWNRFSRTVAEVVSVYGKSDQEVLRYHAQRLLTEIGPDSATVRQTAQTLM